MDNFNNYIYEITNKMRTDELTNILKVVTQMGGVLGLFFIATITVIVMIILKKKKLAIGISLNLIISTITYVILKNIFRCPRPPIEERLIEETGYSFPSGHATNNMAFYAFAIYLVYKNIENKKVRNILCVILAIIPLIIGFSRIYLRVHYPTDVFVGFILGILIVVLFVNLIYKRIEKYY